MKLPSPDAPLCASGKRPFRTEEEALKALHAAQHLRRDGGAQRVPGCTEEKVYRCDLPGCDWWHLSSSAKARRRGSLGNRGRRQVRRRR